MEKLKITANQFILKSYFAILGIHGVLIISGHAYNYLDGEMMEYWILYLGTGLFLAIAGGGYGLGLFNPISIEITVDDEGISSSKSIWDSSFKWSKLKNVTLYKNKIQIQYAESGLKNEIVIPYLLRIGTDNLQKLDEALSGFCEKYDVGFTSELK